MPREFRGSSRPSSRFQPVGVHFFGLKVSEYPSCLPITSTDLHQVRIAENSMLIFFFVVYALLVYVFVSRLPVSRSLSFSFTSQPSGYAADRWSRSKVIRLGTFLGALAGAMTLLALFMGGSDMKQYGLLTAALAFWGAFDGAITSPMQALYADSVPLGQRDVAFMRLFAAQVRHRHRSCSWRSKLCQNF